MIISQKSTKLLVSISATALMMGCSTSIAERSPLDIASDSLRRTDSFSGASEVLAPQIKAFSSNRTSVKGEVQLRTAGPFTDSGGTVHRDGAYLEIVLDYVTATPDPEGGLYFDQANWAGGEAAQLADFGAIVKDCREEAREIYRVPLGYTGYGHRGGHYGHYGRRGYGGYGYGRHGGRYGGHYGGYGRHGNGRRGDGHNDEHRDEQGADDPILNDRVVGSTTDGTPRRGVTRRDLTEDRSRVPAERDPDRSTPRRSDTVRTGGSAGTALPPSRKQPRRRISTSDVKAAGVRRSAPAAAPRPSPPKAAPVSRPSPPPAKRSTSTKKNTSRSVDRAFKNTNNSRTRTRADVKTRMRYDPYTRYNPGYSDYVVDYTCQRQETVRVFIPRERLLAAEKNGLLLYLRPRNGIEETVVLPPNYISGFLLAAYSPDGQRFAVQKGQPQTAIKSPKTEIPAPISEPSARTPIIYGGN